MEVNAEGRASVVDSCVGEEFKMCALVYREPVEFLRCGEGLHRRLRTSLAPAFWTACSLFVS